MKKLLFILVFWLFYFQNTSAQCFEIEAIYVDACGGQEGFNEMVRFKVGSAPINTSTLSVTWPSNAWQGLIQNATTANVVAALNADVVSNGGCGQILQPSGGVLPANALAYLVTGENYDVTLNSFGALMDTVYILFQNNTTVTAGHFGNAGTGFRTLIMSFGACTDQVTYDRTLLVDPFGANIAADGATVLFTPSGQATYTNLGCVAPINPFYAIANPDTITACAGSTINLTGSVAGQQSFQWSAPVGSLSNVNSLATTYTIPASATGTITVTLTATNSCGLTTSDQVNITVTPAVTPDFVTSATYCTGSTIPALVNTSPNGITGTWSPATVNNTTSGSYVFTPNPNQCATPVTLNVTITNSIVPNFATSATYCTGSTIQALVNTSPNGITGTWSPATVSNTASGSYVFTPNPNQCATPVTLNVTITNSIVPNFATSATYCTGSTIPALINTSPNGITGTWSPATVSNTASGSYVFTPNPNQCATPVTLNVTITNSIVPNFATSATYCTGSTIPALVNTSPNGITGTWSPATVSNTNSGSYVFTPNPNQCATPVTLNVTITNSIIPNFATSATYCTGSTIPALVNTSPNGINGTWSPATVSNTASGSYVFTPNPNQCATPVTLNVTITNSIVPNFATSATYCTGSTIPALVNTSPNGITGTWSPATVNNTASGSYVFTPNPNQCATPVTLNVTITNSIVPNFATSATYCTGSTIPALVNTSPNGINGTWSPATVSNTASGSYVFTPNPNQCATPVTLNVTITNSIVPNFATSATYCTGSTIPALVNTSPNGINGTWSPATVSNTASGSYVFTPNPNQCATPVTLNVTITNSIVPNFATSATYCTGSTIPALVNTSPNGITGTWSPATVNNTASGSYVFTPNPNQCATPVTLNVTITNSIVPNFTTSATYCTGSTIPALVTTSPNGITGTWSPATVSNTASGSYVFTPNPNQCATPVTLNVTITNSIVPNFTTSATYCTGSSIPALVNTSPNGITGTWSPATVSNTASGSYVFTPNPNQCSSPITLNVTIDGISGTISGPSSLCAQEVDTFTVSVTGGTWQTNDTSIATIDQNGIVTAIAAGTVTITYSIPGSCTSIISTNLTVFPLPQPILESAFICVDPTTGITLEPAILNCGLSASTHSFSWTLDGNPLPTTTPTHLATSTGVYKVVATHLSTGCSNTTSTTVTTSSFALATAEIAVDFALQQTITVTITGGSGNYIYQLNDGPWQTQPIFTGVPEGENSIGIQDLNGCGIIYVTVYSLNYPRFFTPNGDGFNDTWNISGITEQPNALIAIFDRYGKLLKTIKASEGNGWDGTYNGEPLPATDYWFSLEYVNRNGRTETFKAHFSLKR